MELLDNGQCYATLWDGFWNAISAIATTAAVIVSLYLANRDKKPKRKLDVTNTIYSNWNKGTIELVITLENVGNRLIIIRDCGRLARIDGRAGLDTTYNMYLKDFKEPKTVEIGETVTITYLCERGRSYTEEEIQKDEMYKVFEKSFFVVRDMQGKIYFIDD